MDPDADVSEHVSSGNLEDEDVVSNQGVHKLQPYIGESDFVSSIGPLAPELVSPLISNEREGSGDIKQEPDKNLQKLLDYTLSLTHLAVFGILGVGSFMMGCFGVVFKEDISNVSEYLAIALTTGYLGSLTTFSGWNQKMLELSVNGDGLFCVLGFLIGLFLVAFSIIFGIETAKGFRWLLKRLKMSSGSETCRSKINAKAKGLKHHL